MSETIFVAGCGAVSSAGWGVAPLRDALCKGQPLPVKDCPRAGSERNLRARPVPPPQPRPAFFTHPRLRRASPISQYSVAAALEALGSDAPAPGATATRLGVILCVLTGCVNYSSRFYGELLKDPATASPLVFPETVFNAPASHLAALLGAGSVNYTLVGDQGTFLQGLALAADWLVQERVDGCLIIGAEELDWLTADAVNLFSRAVVLSAGAGAVYLKRSLDSAAPAVGLECVTDAFLFVNATERIIAAQRMRAAVAGASGGSLLCDGLQGCARFDQAERRAWADWEGARLSPKSILGEGVAAAAAWQCVTAIDAVQQGHFSAAIASVVGFNQQAIGARFAAVQ